MSFSNVLQSEHLVHEMRHILDGNHNKADTVPLIKAAFSLTGTIS